MGDIKKIRKKYSKPSHPWRIERITEDNQITKEYGIPKKTELWKAKAKLASIKNQVKSVVTVSAGQTESQNMLQRERLINRLKSYGLITSESSLEAILGITLKAVLDRRLQTIVFKKGFTKTMKQARQLITHKHVLITGKIITSPAYLVRVAEETSIEISPKSPFYDTAHAERAKEASKRPVRKVNTERNKFSKRR